MNVKELAGYIAALEAILEIVPGLVDERHIEKIEQLRKALSIVLSLK